MMKADVLDEFETIKICTAYRIDGKETDEFPYELDEHVEPVFTELPGWHTEISQFTQENEFPAELSSYISFIEEQVGVPIRIVSVGPNRAATVIREIA
jgi:adenylosuccinate synthase